jgi:hypothetical protein
MVSYITMGSGLIIDGQRVLVPGIDVTNYMDDPRLCLDPSDTRSRSDRERSWIHLVVMHTTGGIPGGKDLRPQLILPGFGPSSGGASGSGGDRVVASWTNDKNRPGGAHLVVDFDGTAYCCADLVRDATYHAEKANGCSVGIEVVQGHAQAELYQAQIDAAARLALAICRLLPVPIQWQVPRSYHGSPVRRFASSLAARGPFLTDVVGIVGHRDLTANRGAGDPGDAVMRALCAAGCEQFNFDIGEDLTTWKDRQAMLGIGSPDGIPGPRTVEALRDASHPEGIWQVPRVSANS